MVSNAKKISKNHELFYNEIKTLDPEEVPTRRHYYIIDGDGRESCVIK